MFTEERARWLYQHYRWLDAMLPPRQDGSTARLIRPTAEFFPMRNTHDHAFAQNVFDAVRDFMGLSEWPCRLVVQTDEEQAQREALRNSGVFGESQSSGAAGTFCAGDDVEITYSPALLNDAPGLVATLAHELCHYLLATVREEPPGSWAEHEPLTDLAAVREGFGIFLCNSAFQFSQWSDAQFAGWRSSTRGYLNEAELGFALGIFCMRTRTPPDQAGLWLKPNPREVFWDSLGFIEELEHGAGGSPAQP